MLRRRERLGIDEITRIRAMEFMKCYAKVLFSAARKPLSESEYPSAQQLISSDLAGI
jgi:hypothetical protein